MRKTKPVRECMSRLPADVDRREPLSAAVARMREQHAHHLPVMDGSRVHGILSSIDLQALALGEHTNLEKATVGEVCTRDPLAVGPMTPVSEVAQAMLERQVSSALITDGGALVGIFTTTDALRLIAEL